MEDDPSQYRLLPLKPSDAQEAADRLVDALWRCRFQQLRVGQNHQLDLVFVLMSRSKWAAGQSLLPYYFDQVTEDLPSRAPGGHRENCSLQISDFDSWANGEDEQREDEGGRDSRTSSCRCC